VTIDFDRHLIGHSDADGLLHAVTDALLGAAALGDIGDYFPEADPANLDRDSAEILSFVLQKVVDSGWSVVNVDCIVFAERPRLSDYKVAIRTRIAEILGLAPDQVGLKAKTGEGIGQVGHQESIEAQAVVLLARR